MPTSAPGRCSGGAARGRGFTLIEVMIVLVVVAALASSFALSIEGRDGGEDEIERLRLALEAAAEHAETRGTPLAVDFVAQGYRFSRFDAFGNWTPLAGEATFAERGVAGLAWRGLVIDGQEAPPRLVFGAAMPDFVLRIDTPAGEVRLSGLPTGAVVRLPRSEG